MFSPITDLIIIGQFTAATFFLRKDRSLSKTISSASSTQIRSKFKQYRPLLNLDIGHFRLKIFSKIIKALNFHFPPGKTTEDDFDVKTEVVFLMIKRVWNCNNVIKVKFLDNPKSQQATGNHRKLNFGIERVLLSREVDKQGRLGDSFTTLGERITFKNTRKYSILFRLIRTKFVQHWFTRRKPLCKIGNDQPIRDSAHINC